MSKQITQIWRVVGDSILYGCRSHIGSWKACQIVANLLPAKGDALKTFKAHRENEIGISAQALRGDGFHDSR